VKRYTIQYVRPARKDLEALPYDIQDRIVAAIDALQDDPRPRGCKKLKGSDNEYRIRVGNYRVIYEIHEKTVVVLIVRIRDRKDAYQ
jgi:mRNA interferase RelE/StbE